jgi:NADH-quinone oxidoreductase subunit A
LNIIPDHSNLIWPLLVYTAGVLALVVGVMLGVAYLLGQRHKDRSTGEIYESGIAATGSSQLRFSVHFYLVAMFFVIFDLEAVFIVAWAISFKEVGWTGYAGVAVFIGILLAVLVYELRIGALDFGLSGKKVLKQYRKLNKSFEEI